MGLFGDIQRAWITVDNRLYLWNFASGQDFQAYEDHAHTITCVQLVRPKPGVFVAGITHVLVIATMHEIFLLGVAAPKDHAGELQFYATRMSVPVAGIDVSCIEASSTGRIFFAGKIDTHIYELSYQAEEGWFTRRCSKINHTGSAIDNFMPSALISRSSETIVQICIDDSRKILYTLSSKSTIRAYGLEEPASLSLNVTYSYSSAASHAQMVNAASPLLDPRSTSIVSISAIPVSESKQIYLLAVTSTGCRLYMRSTSSSFYNPSSTSISSLQVSHVRFPPALPHTVPSGNNNNNKPPNSLVQTNQQQQGNPSQVLANSIDARTFAPGLFFAVRRETGAEPGDMLFAAAPELNKIALQFSSGNTRPILSEACCWVPIDGFVQDFCRINGTGVGMGGIGSELVTQFSAQPSTFAVLTNTGVHVIRRRRTVEVFASALRHSPATSGGLEGEMRKFFENIGRAEGCATCLGVICGSLDGTDVDSEALKAFNSSYGAKLSASEVLDTSRRYFIEFGGKAFVDENQNRAFAQDGTVMTPTLDMVRLSGRHDGLALYVSRLLSSFWRSPIIRAVSGAPVRRIDYIANLPPSTIVNVQGKLISLSEFLETNKNFIEGLSGPDRLLNTTNKTEEVILQAEHRGMHALVTLIKQIIEGLSFIQVLCDSPDQKMTDVILSLPPQFQQEATQLSFEQLISADRGREIAKELITTIVNRRIAQGGTVESVSETLQKRCGTFCSADDVILYKAIEKLRKAKESTTVGERDGLLTECLQLFEHAATTLSLDNLKDTMDEFASMQFYSGAIGLAFSIARAKDPYNLALNFLSEGKPADDSRSTVFAHRESCYSYIFNVLDRLEQAFASQEEAYAGTPNVSPLLSRRDAAYEVISNAEDELFHNLFYDWYESRGLRERLLDIESPYIEGYLERKARQSVDFADLLWQYHARKTAYIDAARVLYDLSRSDFKLNLEARMEYLSQAKNFCACVPIQEHTAQLAALHQNVSEELDVSSIQDDVLSAVKAETRLAENKKQELITKLDGQLIPLTDLFNNYADPLSYHVICLCIFQAADYRGSLEIRSCWEKLVESEHDKAEAQNAAAPYEYIALLIKSLGRRFSTYQNVFPIDDILPILENYNLTKQRKAPRGWVIDALLAAGTPYEVLFPILDEMYEQPTWQGKTATTMLIGETVYMSKLWYEASLKPRLSKGYSDFDPAAVRTTLQRYAQILRQQPNPSTSELRSELEMLEKRIKSTY